MDPIRRFALLLSILVLLLASEGPVSAQSSGDAQYFPETGHNLKGEFLRFYKNASNPLLVFGYPITEQLTSHDGKTVQYFQRARFELRADLPERQRVQLTPLGKATYQPGSQQFGVSAPGGVGRYNRSVPGASGRRRTTPVVKDP